MALDPASTAQRLLYSRSLRLGGPPCYSWLVQLEEFLYPAYGAPLVEAYGGRFESAFIVLHPFVRVPAALSWSVTRQYPSDAQIAEFGAKCSWSEVASQVGINSCARMNQALLTSIGSLAESMADPAGRDTLQSFLESQPVWMPVEGRFEPLLQPDFLQIFAASGAEELVFVPEFPQSDPVVRLGVDGLKDGTIPFPNCGHFSRPMLRSYSRWTGTVSSRSLWPTFLLSRCRAEAESGGLFRHGKHRPRLVELLDGLRHRDCFT